MFHLTITGDLNAEQFSAIASILATGTGASSVLAGPSPASVSPVAATPASAGSKPDVAAPKKPEVSKPTKDAKPANVPAAVPDTPVVDPPAGPRTIDQLKELVVARCSPSAENKLEIRDIMKIIRGVVDVKTVADVPPEFVSACYDAVEQA